MIKLAIKLIILILIINKIDLTNSTDESNESINDATTSNDFFSYLFGTTYSMKSDQDKNINDTDLKTENQTKREFLCNPRVYNATNQTSRVKLVTLLTRNYIPLVSESNIELIDKNNECVLLLLYFDWCPHSIKIAPYYNAIGRAYPQLHVVAMNSYNHNGVNLRLSIFGVPSIVLIQNDRFYARFNGSDINLTTLKAFITKLTPFQPIHELEINDDDLIGPVPTKIQEQFDYIMLACIVFLVFTFVYFAFNHIVRIYIYLLEAIRSTWLESQREHLD